MTARYCRTVNIDKKRRVHPTRTVMRFAKKVVDEWQHGRQEDQFVDLASDLG